MGIFIAAREVATFPELSGPPTPRPDGPTYLLGLDLGCVSDPSALAVIEKTSEEKDSKKVNHYAVRHLQRWLNVSYPDIAEQLRPIARALNRSELIVDSTGVGVAVVGILKKARLPIARLVPVTITGGNSVTESKLGGWNVAKKELVSVTQSALQGKRLAIAPKLKEAATLKRELQNFKVKINIASASESFEAWRENEHDDLVLAVCLAVWRGERPQWKLPAGGVWW